MKLSLQLFSLVREILTEKFQVIQKVRMFLFLIPIRRSVCKRGAIEAQRKKERRFGSSLSHVT